MLASTMPWSRAVCRASWLGPAPLIKKITPKMATIATMAATHQPALEPLRRMTTVSGSRVTVVRS